MLSTKIESREDVTRLVPLAYAEVIRAMNVSPQTVAENTEIAAQVDQTLCEMLCQDLDPTRVLKEDPGIAYVEVPLDDIFRGVDRTESVSLCAADIVSTVIEARIREESNKIRRRELEPPKQTPDTPNDTVVLSRERYAELIQAERDLIEVEALLADNLVAEHM